MQKGPNREKINPEWASRKGSKPTWNTAEESRHHWRKTFYIRGVKAGKRVQKKLKKFTRKSIHELIDT